MSYCQTKDYIHGKTIATSGGAITDQRRQTLAAVGGRLCAHGVRGLDRLMLSDGSRAQSVTS